MKTILEYCFSILLLSVLLTGCASAQKPTNPQDPYETFNRHIFKFNERADKYVFKPAAETYRAITPRPLRTGVTNFFRNLGEPTNIANDLFQGDYINFMGDSWRFVINSTFGIGGIFDIACQMKKPINYHPNDFGLTMARYGITKPNYLVLPLLGPSTDRDTFGLIVDYYGLSVYHHIEPASLRIGMLGLFYINTRSEMLDYQKLFDIAALDPYVFQRNAYLQHRSYLVEKMQQTLKEEYHH